MFTASTLKSGEKSATHTMGEVSVMSGVALAPSEQANSAKRHTIPKRFFIMMNFDVCGG